MSQPKKPRAQKRKARKITEDDPEFLFWQHREQQFALFFEGLDSYFSSLFPKPHPSAEIIPFPTDRIRR